MLLLFILFNSTVRCIIERLCADFVWFFFSYSISISLTLSHLIFGVSHALAFSFSLPPMWELILHVISSGRAVCCSAR